MYNYKKGDYRPSCNFIDDIHPTDGNIPSNLGAKYSIISGRHCNFQSLRRGIPGQIVTYTWSGLPGNLIPPVLSVFD